MKALPCGVEAFRCQLIVKLTAKKSEIFLTGSLTRPIAELNITLKFMQSHRLSPQKIKQISSVSSSLSMCIVSFRNPSSP